MAKIDQVRHLLRHVSHATVSRKKDGCYPVLVHGVTLSVAEAVIDQYLSLRDAMKRPYETAIAVPGYYEQAIEFQGHVPITSRMMRGDELMMENKDKTRTISVSPVSDLFTLVLLDAETISRDFNRFFRMSLSRLRWQRERGNGDGSSISALLARIRTVKVSTTIDDHLPRARNGFRRCVRQHSSM